MVWAYIGTYQAYTKPYVKGTVSKMVEICGIVTRFFVKILSDWCQRWKELKTT